MDASELSRRAMLKHVTIAGLGAAGGPQWVHELIASACAEVGRTQKNSWNPVVLTGHQNATVTTLSELIIPETETPGAASVNVNRHIDTVLSDATPDIRERFIDGLCWIDAHSRALHGVDFIEATADQQVAILESISRPERSQEAIGIEFFAAVKSLTIHGYYTSEAGLREELGEIAGAPHEYSGSP
jgi:hypothetical protein